MLKTKVFAKVNLFLHVNGKTANDYHLLDSLVAFCDNIYDTIEIKDSSNFQIICQGQHATEITDNILLKTIKVLEPYIINTNFTIKLKKNIPIGGGLGGGSADAASLINLLKTSGKLQISENKLQAILPSIGADVPICYHNRSAYFNGIGEKITPVKNFPKIWAVILFPNINISTKKIFSLGFKPYKQLVDKKLSFNNCDELLNYLRDKENDLFANTMKISADLQNCISIMEKQENCKLARMTGSGSAIFGLFKTKNHAINAARCLNKRCSFFVKYTGLF